MSIVITRATLASSCGIDANRVLDAALLMQPGFNLHPELTMRTVHETHSPVLYAPAGAAGQPPTQAIENLLSQTQIPVLQHVDQNPLGSIGVFTLLPSSQQLRSLDTKTHQWREQWREHLLASVLHDEHLRFAWQAIDDQPSTSNIHGGLYWLARMFHLLTASDEFTAIAFAGVDSLVDSLSMRQWLASNQLSARGYDSGFIPGEGAACFLLRREEDVDDGEEILARIKTLSLVAENEPTEDTLQDVPIAGNLTAAVEQVLQTTNLTSEDIAITIHAGSNTITDEVEWHDTAQSVFGASLTEKQRLDIARGHLNPASLPESKEHKRISLPSILGHLGAASIPMQIAAGVAALQKPSLHSNHALIIETGEDHGRGALLLERPTPWPNKKPTDDNDFFPFKFVPAHPRDNAQYDLTFEL